MRPSADENICRQCGEHDDFCRCRCTECNANMWLQRKSLRGSDICVDCIAEQKGADAYEQEQAS